MQRVRGQYVRDTVPAVPVPTADPTSLLITVLALKQAVEELLRRVSALETRLGNQ